MIDPNNALFAALWAMVISVWLTLLCISTVRRQAWGQVSRLERELRWLRTRTHRQQRQLAATQRRYVKERHKRLARSYRLACERDRHLASDPPWVLRQAREEALRLVSSRVHRREARLWYRHVLESYRAVPPYPLP